MDRTSTQTESGDLAQKPPVDHDKATELAGIAHRLRRRVIDMVHRAGSGHPGGSLSAAEIVACLYFQEMKIDPALPDWPERDRFILSKGHACPILYAALAERGYFPLEVLNSLRRVNGPLSGHPDMRKTIGIDMSTGSLGNGLGCAVGMALAARLRKARYFVYVLLGDGEIQEGIVWEAAMAAAHFKLGCLVAIIDYNGLQLDGPVAEIMAIEPLLRKWRAFGWRARSVDGHSPAELMGALAWARRDRGQPSMIIARTIKGKGVSFMENDPDWHGRVPDDAQYTQAMIELA